LDIAVDCQYVCFSTTDLATIVREVNETQRIAVEDFRDTFLQAVAQRCVQLCDNKFVGIPDVPDDPLYYAIDRLSSIGTTSVTIDLMSDGESVFGRCSGLYYPIELLIKSGLIKTEDCRLDKITKDETFRAFWSEAAVKTTLRMEFDGSNIYRDIEPEEILQRVPKFEYRVLDAAKRLFAFRMKDDPEDGFNFPLVDRRKLEEFENVKREVKGLLPQTLTREHLVGKSKVRRFDDTRSE
jgi:hypothetical protein